MLVKKESLLHRQIVASSCPKIDLPIFQWIFNGHFLEKQQSTVESWQPNEVVAGMSLLQLKRRGSHPDRPRACVCQIGGRAERSPPGFRGACGVGPIQFTATIHSFFFKNWTMINILGVHIWCIYYIISEKISAIPKKPSVPGRGFQSWLEAEFICHGGAMGDDCGWGNELLITGGFHKWLYPMAGWFNITGDIPWLIIPIGSSIPFMVYI